MKSLISATALPFSKMDFTARVGRAQGKNTLYPQGYHATGMPIKACVDKLVKEMAMLGELFDGYTEDDAGLASPEASDASQPRAREDVTKFANAKKGAESLIHHWKSIQSLMA